MFTYVFAHANVTHFFGNFMLILVVGPMVEEKYGSRQVLTMMIITAVVTGLVQVIFFPYVALVGASGLVFMLILLSSFANSREGHIPITLVLVAIFYLGNEVVGGLLQNDNISQLAHIGGGLCGAAFGFIFNRNKLR